MRLATLAITLLSLGSLAQAHEGHGIAGASHWHATDSGSWIIALAVMAVGYLLSRK